MTSITSIDAMSISFMTASPMGLNIGKSPVGRLTDSMLVSEGGAPLQPTLPSRYPHTKMVESESTGVQCPSAQTEAELPELVH